MKTNGYRWASAIVVAALIGLLLPTGSSASGRTRLVPLDQILTQTQVFLIVDLPSRKTQSQEVSIPLPEKEPLKLKIVVESIEIAQVLSVSQDWKGAPLKKGTRVHYVATDAQRTLTYQTTYALSGARRSLWYDYNPAFTQEETGESSPKQGILLLKRYDKDVTAGHASMGHGILPLSHLEKIRAHLTKAKDRLIR